MYDNSLTIDFPASHHEWSMTCPMKPCGPVLSLRDNFVIRL